MTSYKFYVSSELATLHIVHPVKSGENVDVPILFVADFITCYMGTNQLTFNVVNNKINFIAPETGIVNVAMVSKAIRVKFFYEFYFNRSDMLEFDKDSLFVIKATFECPVTIDREMSVKILKFTTQGIETTGLIEMTVKRLTPGMVIKIADIKPTFIDKKYVHTIGSPGCDLVYDFRFPDHLSQGNATIYRRIQEDQYVFVCDQKTPFVPEGSVLSLNCGKSMKVNVVPSSVMVKYRQVRYARQECGATCIVGEDSNNVVEREKIHVQELMCSNMTSSEAKLLLVFKSNSITKISLAGFSYADGAIQWTVPLPSGKTDEKVDIEITESVQN